MPPKSPADIENPTLMLTIKVNGSPIKDYYPINSVNITHEINKISFAEIVLLDGSVETGDFPISDSNDFIPGNDIEITAGYGSDTEKSIFKGVIVKQGVQINSSEAYNLIITCKHKAVSMTFNKKESAFTNKTDSAIIKAIIDTYSLTATVDSTTPLMESTFQKLATDWDFVLSRAEFNGFIITFDGDKMTIGKPALNGEAVLRVAFGESIISFNAELNAEKQAPSLEATAWDIKNQVLLKSTAAEPAINLQGNLTAKSLSGKLQQTKLSLNSVTPMAQDELKAWADGNLLRMRLGAQKGQVSFVGNAAVKAGSIIEIAGVGERFNGNAFVSSLTHQIAEGEWLTNVKFGLDSRAVYERMNISYPAAAGQMPAIHGLQVATVKKLFEDPESQFRILISLPSNAEAQDGIWARMANFYATSSAGAGFLPEVGDEVIVGFLESNPKYPIILGALYSNAKQAVATPADNNNYIKSLITKSQLKLSFDDEKKVIIIETPGGNKITFSDEAKSVEIEDQNSNSVKMTSSGIDLQSGKDINIKATGNITLNATGKLNLTATQDVAVAGLNISNTANVGFTAKGNATAEISAAGQTVVKGAMVMIN